MKPLASTLILLCFLLSCDQPEPSIRLNDLQMIGSHNSYKKAIAKPILNYIAAIDSMESVGLEYDHVSLTEQLDLGLRSIEIDVFYDPEGGFYKNPIGLQITADSGEEPRPFDMDDKLSVPGLKVFHIQEVDFRSHELLFKEALAVVKEWSDQNPEHTPIIITMNAKDEEVEQTRNPYPFTVEALKTIDQEILDVIGAENLITPDLIKGDHISLEEAVLLSGWPHLDEMKSKFLFVLDEVEPKRGRYISIHPGLQGAVLFVNQEAGNPEAGFMIINDPINDFDLIQDMVSKGYMVRTRADAGTIEARNNDYSRFNKAKESGAQIITTDYYIQSNLFDSDYKVIYDDGTYERIRSDE